MKNLPKHWQSLCNCLYWTSQNIWILKVVFQHQHQTKNIWQFPRDLSIFSASQRHMGLFPSFLSVFPFCLFIFLSSSLFDSLSLNLSESLRVCLSPFLYLSLFLCLSSSVFPYLSFKSTYVNFVIFLLKSLAVPTALSIDFIFLFFRYVCLSLTLFRSFSPSFKLSAKKFRLKPNETKKKFPFKTTHSAMPRTWPIHSTKRPLG